MCSTDLFLALIAVLFPPLPVWVKRGICSADSIINFLLFILGYVPGLLHAWYIIAKYPEPPFDYDYHNVPRDAEHGRVYVFVHHGQAQPPPQGHMNYGTASSNNQAACGSPGAPPASPKPSSHRHQHQHQPQEQGTTSAAGPSDGSAPPSYAQVVAGDHKVQTHD